MTDVIITNISGGENTSPTEDAGLEIIDSGVSYWTKTKNILKNVTSLAGYSWFLDEDDMASNSATKAPSQKSVKAFVLSDTHTLTNKTLTRPTITNPAETHQTLTDAATVNWNMDSGASAQVTLAGNRTMAAPTNLRAGGTYLLLIIQDGTGSRTITWNAVFKWAGGTAPVLSTAASSKDIISFWSDGTNLYGGGIIKALA